MEKKLTDINPIKLFENKKLSAKMKISDDEYSYPEISLEYGKPPQIQLRADIKDKDISVESINDNYFDTYFISDIHRHNIFLPAIFKYLFIGKADKDKLNKVYFTIPELSSYFNIELNYNLDNDSNLSGNLKIPQLEAKVESLGLSIRVHQGYNFKENEDHTGFSFKNIIYFSYESDAYLSFQDIENLMYKTIGLLTWVTGYPVSIESVEVSDGEKDGYLYISSVKKLKKYDTSHPKSFMHVKALRVYFNQICNNYFDKKEIFENIWSRTLPLFDFTGVLEYEVMLYTSILDRYFSYQYEKIKPVQNKNYSSHILKIENFFKTNNEFKNLLEGIDLIDTIQAKKLFPKIKNPTFIDKKDAYFQHIGEDNLKIFISDEDFKKIKYIRDKTAHGNKVELDTDDVLKYLWKVKILTMYFIYIDLGIKEDDFFVFISNTLHPIPLNCEMDEYLLNLKIGKTILMNLDQVEREKTENSVTNVKVFNKKNDHYIFNLKLSQQAHEYFLENKSTEYNPTRFYSYEKYVQHLIDQEDINLKAKYYSKAYLNGESSEETIDNAIILNSI